MSLRRLQLTHRKAIKCCTTEHVLEDCFSFCDNLIRQEAFFQAGTLRTRPWNTHRPFFGQNSTESTVYRIKTENRFVL